MNHSAEIAALKQRIEQLEEKLTPKPPEPDNHNLGIGPPRDARGDIISNPTARSYEERSAEIRANNLAVIEAERAERAANNGYAKDPCGIWRDRNGRMRPSAGLVAKEKAEREAVEREMAKDLPRLRGDTYTRRRPGDDAYRPKITPSE